MKARTLYKAAWLIMVFLLVNSVFGVVAPNASAAGANLISNPSVETADPGTPDRPAGWQTIQNKEENAVFTYPVAGQDGEAAIRVEVDKKSKESAGWIFDYVPVEDKHTYIFSDYFQSSGESEVIAYYLLKDNKVKKDELGKLKASADWTNAEFKLKPPKNAVAVTVLHSLKNNGVLTTDNYNLLDKDGDNLISIDISASAPGNIILNPSFEEGIESAPSHWFTSSWGTNVVDFTYPVAGQDGDRAARVDITSHTSGDAKWAHEEVPVTPGQQYDFSDYYISNTNSAVNIQYTMADGSYQFAWVSDVAPATDWQQFQATVTVPADAVGMIVMHLIYGTGFLVVDNYSLSEHTVAAASVFDKGLVSLSFDDGWNSQLKEGVKVLDKEKMKGTFYIVTSDTINADQEKDSIFMNSSELLKLQKKGHEIGNHTRTHAHLTTLTEEQASEEINGAKNDLLDMGISTVDSFAYPYGEFNANVQEILQTAGYAGARGVERGFNYKNTDKYALKIQQVDRLTTKEQIKDWIDAAEANHTWLILMFHQIDDSDSEYGTTKKILSETVKYLKKSKTEVVTVSEGLALMD